MHIKYFHFLFYLFGFEASLTWFQFIFQNRYCTNIVHRTNNILYFAEWRKREINHSLKLFICFRFFFWCMLSSFNYNGRKSGSFRKGLLWKISNNNISIINLFRMWRVHIITFIWKKMNVEKVLTFFNRAWFESNKRCLCRHLINI